MRAAAVLVVLAACGGAPAPTAPLSGRAAPRPRPTTPAPTVQWIDNGFDTHGLPAVAHDGSRVVFARIDSDGGRGNPNLTLVVVDRQDTQLEQLVVLAADDVDAMFDEHGPVAAFRAKIADGNRRLAELHTRHELVPLAALEVDRWRMRHGEKEERPPAERRHATGDRVVIDWTSDRLTVAIDDRQVLARPVPAAWSPADRPLCATCAEVCHNEPFFAAAWADVARSVALVTVTFTGTDTCWEPNAQHHVVAW